MFLWLLIIVTSSYISTIATYPDQRGCIRIGNQVLWILRTPPRAVMADVLCVPTFVMPTTAVPTMPRPHLLAGE